MAYPSPLHVQTTVDLLFQDFTLENFATFFQHAPESAIFEEWMGVLDRLMNNGYRNTAMTACGFCMFDALVDGDEKLLGLYETLLAVTQGVERSPPSLPHKVRVFPGNNNYLLQNCGSRIRDTDDSSRAPLILATTLYTGSTLYALPQMVSQILKISAESTDASYNTAILPF